MTKYVRALYDFRGKESGDLSFKEDDILKVKIQDDSGWWTGEDKDGRQGEFPFNYVEVIDEAEAIRAMRGRGASSSRHHRGVGGDRVTGVRVLSVDQNSKRVLFKLEAKLKSGKSRKLKKTLPQLRELYRQLKKVFPSFESQLPPKWCDSAKLGSLDSDRRNKAIEAYLNKLSTNDTSSLMMLLWMFPSEQIDLSGATPEVKDAANRAIRAGTSDISPKLDRYPTLAHVEFTWKPQDDVELYMREDQVIEVVSQETGSPGWWLGKTVDGLTGLFPYNHVELLDDRVAKAVVNGTSLSRAQKVHYEDQQGGYAVNNRRSLARISLDVFKKKGGGDKSKTQVQSRQKKIVYPFTISSVESFDRLIDNGFTMESPDGSLVSLSSPSNAPKEGQYVQLSYCAYVWDCQKQSIVEFAASDNPSKLTDAGPMEFIVGKGEVIKGIEYAVTRMTRDQKVRLIVTPSNAYGAVGLPQADVPPHAHVVYDLTLDAFGDGSPKEKSRGSYTDDDVVMSRAQYTRNDSGSSYSKAPKPSGSKPSSRDRGRNHEKDHRKDKGKRGTESKSPRGGFNPPVGKDTQLANALAKRRAKLENMKPIQERNQKRAPTNNAFAGRDRVEISRDSDNRGRREERPKERKPSKLYTLRELQEAVRDKKLRSLGIDPGSIEDWLTDDEFKKAFHMSRTDFLLKPRWRQAALKRGVKLF